MIRVEKLSKYYGKDENKITALNQVDITINEQDFIAVIGPSGSGKSTFLHAISGLDKPSSGKVLYDGKEDRKSVV